MCTWATIFNALSRSEVSAQLRNSHMHIIEQNKSYMATESTNQSINHKISYVGPPPKPCFILHELIPWISIIWNYGIGSTLISKHFKIKRSIHIKKMKRLAEEENGNQNFIKNGTLEPKEAFGMKSLGDLKLFENQNLSNYSQSEVQGIHFQKQRRGNERRWHVTPR